MELKLDIYEKKEIVKTYTANTYDLMFGTVEDFVNLVDLDALESGSDAEIAKLVVKATFGGMDMVKNLLKDIFEGITDEELKHTKTSDIVKVVVNIVKYTMAEMVKGLKLKN